MSSRRIVVPISTLNKSVTRPSPSNTTCLFQRWTIPTTTTTSITNNRSFTKKSRPAPKPADPSQPSSHRPYDARKTLLHRTYISLLRSTPLIVVFQHNNVRGIEWVAIRRELAAVLANIDKSLEAAHTSTEHPPPKPIAPLIKVNVIQGNVFAAALRIAEFLPADLKSIPASSREAYDATKDTKKRSELEPLLVGPLGILEVPIVSTQHLQAALNLLFPTKLTFKKGTDPHLIAGVTKLLLLGARIEGQTMDGGMARWVSGSGGVEQLRGELVAMLQSFGQSVASTLDSPARSLWFAMEGRRTMLEEEGKPPQDTSGTPPS